jgi:hypothetical protein
MKVTDAMVEAAARAYGAVLGSYFPEGRGYDELMPGEIKIAHESARAALEAGIAAWVKPTRAESARARWDAMTPEQRRLHTAPALKGRLQSQGYLDDDR